MGEDLLRVRCLWAIAMEMFSRWSWRTSQGLSISASALLSGPWKPELPVPLPLGRAVWFALPAELCRQVVCAILALFVYPSNTSSWTSTACQLLCSQKWVKQNWCLLLWIWSSSLRKQTDKTFFSPHVISETATHNWWYVMLNLPYFFFWVACKIIVGFIIDVILNMMKYGDRSY